MKCERAGTSSEELLLYASRMDSMVSIYDVKYIVNPLNQHYLLNYI